ncbi:MULTISPECIES: histone deacetylase [unclassified Methylophaga]|uniref:histone deacetylase family protein n=1 Tax=unclassified Methylophaga TaxID=2629249 RepID=UPI000C8F750B|nr:MULTISPECIES: histone deacetylase [unclassified Methylophaga]MAK68068.1 histone deacetylase [Methylophaga sp.]MAY16843.1 histone deacetylase [Methylophaga sp.]HAO25184.1 histone deacetylase [Methylophaga sp.]
MQRRDVLKLGVLGAISTKTPAASPTALTGLVIDPRFADYHIMPQHPESPARYDRLMDELEVSELLSNVTLLKPKGNIDSELLLIHSATHIASIKRHDPKAHQAAMLATGGVLVAVDAVCKGLLDNVFCASRPPGHHATNTGKEEGFCYYNHVAIAARYAQKRYKLKRILIVDWDYHHGNGTEWAFYHDPSVLFFSTHDAEAYPGTGSPEKTGGGTGKGFNINVHLPCGAGDAEIVAAFEEKLVPAVAKFKPDLILISAGFDSREDDLLGCYKVTDHGFIKLTQIMLRLAKQHCDGRLVSVLEGGYNLTGNAKASVAHLKALMQIVSSTN